MAKQKKVGILPLMMAILAIVSLALLAYGYLEVSISSQRQRAAQLEQDGQFEAALEEYKTLVDDLGRFNLLKSQFRSDYSEAMTGQLRLLYRLEKYDDAVEFGDICIQEEVQDMAAAYFWSGNAYFQKGMNEEAMEDAFAWFNRAQDQYRKALEKDAGQRWNIRFNYELIRTALEQASENEDDQPVKILRPKDQIQQADTRIIG